MIRSIKLSKDMICTQREKHANPQYGYFNFSKKANAKEIMKNRAEKKINLKFLNFKFMILTFHF